MRVTLVTCFNAEWQFGRLPSPYIPLNLLCLAAAVRERGHQVQILDQTLALMRGEAEDGPRFHGQIARLIRRTEPDVVGFSTMCNCYPQSLTLARRYRRLHAKAKIVFGGPQATAVDVQSLQHFPWIDIVVRGEADCTLPDLLDVWEAGRPIDDEMPGLTWRDGRGEVHRNPSPPLLEDLDLLPFPAYDQYPAADVAAPWIPVEAGRGCPFDCTFCSTNLFFSRRYRIKSPGRLVAELQHLHETYGFKDFDLVHDMLTVNKRWVAEFSRLLIDRQCGFTWGCSARVDCVTPDLLTQMAASGCTGIFFGIETGSQRLQPLIKKELHMAAVLPTLRRCAELGMRPTGSFITGFPDETAEDAAASLEMALDVLQLSPNTTAQLHLLAPLVGSPLYAKHRDGLVFDGHSSDISLFLLTAAETELIRRHPDVFSNFYFIPTPRLDRSFTKAISASLYTVPILLIVLRRAGVDLVELLSGWVAWQSSNLGDERFAQDYYLDRFGLDFCQYLRDEILPVVADAAPHLRDFIELHDVRFRLEKRRTDEDTLYREFDFDLADLAQQARTDGPWPPVERRRNGMLFINLGRGSSRGCGYMYLDVPIPLNPRPLIRPGDVLEIPNLAAQLQTQPKLLIYNKTQNRLLLTEHHMTSQTLRQLGLETVRTTSNPLNPFNPLNKEERDGRERKDHPHQPRRQRARQAPDQGGPRP
ncbi:MAG TPA: radical SAM protein [Thermoanaerobaculia bacterium]|nr:radical SAM protein [Thermoanaerobaculia bacterium]